MELPVFPPGATIVAEERWHDLLWSAVPQRVVQSSATELVSYLPTGTVAVHATNRGLPCAQGLTRDERKLLALKTREVWAGESAEAPDKLYIYRPDRWSRMNLGWDRSTSAFLGWYVNFELPSQPTAGGIVSKDLVLDIWVAPDRSWSWKDRGDYQQAIADGILDPTIRDAIDGEVERVLDEIHSQSGPFSDSWISFRPDSNWAVPQLPPELRWGGSSWTLPVGPRLKS
jgi:hypothetical protein